MRIWTSLWIVLILSGCASQAVELPEWDIEPLNLEELQGAESLPQLCDLKKAASGEMLGWDGACVKAFLAYEEVAEFNTLAAEDLLSALTKTEAASQHIIDAARMQREIAIIRQDLLEESRRQHTMDKWFYRLFIVAIGAAAL